MRKLVERIRTIKNYWHLKFSGPGPTFTDTEQVAEGIVQYAQMIERLKPGHTVILGVKHIAIRFREEPDNVIKAFVSLQKKGRADAISGKHRWRMRA